MTQQQIAEAFSTGNFEPAYPCLADSVEWIIAGENHFKGKKAVMDNCMEVAAYFKTVTTDFKTMNVIAGVNRVAVNGTATFLRDGKVINVVHACDVYEFTSNNELQTITSYCIQSR